MVILVIVSVSNGANLTDGLDGLATGVSAIAGFTLIIFAYVSGNAILADYLNVYFIPNSGELVIYAACFVGACIGFLWWNSYPAQVFMGRYRKSWGGIIATLAIVLRKELLVPVLCGIFLIENVSVVLQVSYFKSIPKKNTGKDDGFSKCLRCIIIIKNPLSRTKNSQSILDRRCIVSSHFHHNP